MDAGDASAAGSRPVVLDRRGQLQQHVRAGSEHGKVDDAQGLRHQRHAGRTGIVSCVVALYIHARTRLTALFLRPPG